jgi:hypothetical protein
MFRQRSSIYRSRRVSVWAGALRCHGGPAVSQRLERAPSGIGPGDREQTVAAWTAGVDGVAPQRRAGAAAGAYAVAGSPARRWVVSATEAGHDGPQRRTERQNQQEGSRHGHRQAIHFENCRERRSAEDAIPRATANVTAGAYPGPGPLLHGKHDHPPDRRWGAHVGGGGATGLSARSQIPRSGSGSVFISPIGGPSSRRRPEGAMLTGGGTAR